MNQIDWIIILYSYQWKLLLIHKIDFVMKFPMICLQIIK